MLSKKEITQKIAGIRTSSAAIRSNIQLVLVSIAAHAYIHNDVSMYDKLFAACSGLNRKRVAIWASKHGFARVTKSGFRLNKAAQKNAQFNTAEDVANYLTNNAPMWYEDEESMQQVARAVNIVARIDAITNLVAKGTRECEYDPEEFDTAIQKLQRALSRRTTQELAGELAALKA